MKAVLLSGVLGSQAKVTKRGVICIADDGDLCRSMGELAIDNWLYANGIGHICEPKYPVHPTLNPKGNLRADWLVGDSYIEYFGLAGELSYDRKIQRKLALAESLGIQLIPIYPSDMKDLDATLRVIFQPLN